MKTTTLSATVVMLLTASATTLLANGPMGSTSSGDRYHPYRTGPMGGVTVLRRR